MKIARDIRHERDVIKALNSLPEGSKVLQVLPSNIPSAITIIYTEKPKPKRVHKVSKPFVPRAPPKPAKVEQP